jgi:fructose-1,6-bisphosphatase/inositol monophosphatase family enzyme
MSQDYQFGAVNGHIIGRVAKETVRRAIVAIRNEQAAFDITAKVGYSSGKMDDVFTSADTAAQEIYLKMVQECFPLHGVVAEEDKLRIEPSGGCRAVWTIDPLDGTKAFIREQSHGIGTMIALVLDGEVISAYIGDINTMECFGYRPGSNQVHRITRLDIAKKLTYKPLKEGKLYALLRDPPSFYGRKTRKLLKRCNNHQVDGGSIGTWMARLWKREVGAVCLTPGTETPWDAAPILGISLKLGYAFYRPVRGGWNRYIPEIPLHITEREHDTVVIHEKDAGLLFD